MDRGVEKLGRGNCFNLNKWEKGKRRGMMIGWTEKGNK